MIVTTRVSNVPVGLTSDSGHQMNFLDEDQSWDLFQKVMFKEDDWPLELKDIGKKIARNCRGLPLSIVVIGGILRKLERSIRHREYVGSNLSSIVNLDDNEYCKKILQLSYKELPIHLKPCFLYMGIYPEDEVICVSYLVKLWVSEGILKPTDGKSMETVGKECIKDLVDRSFLSVEGWGSTGTIKYCRIHDFLRDLSKRQAQKESFFHVMGEQSLDLEGGMNTHRRIVVRRILSKVPLSIRAQHALQSASLVRSLSWEYGDCLPSVGFRLLRLLNVDHTLSRTYSCRFQTFFQLYNSRLLCFSEFLQHYAPSFQPLSHIWNLQTLIISLSTCQVNVAAAIWEMPQLRHVKVPGLKFQHPRSNLALMNLQTLSHVAEFVCSEEVVTRIPNIKKLEIMYGENTSMESYQLNNLARLHKLEHLKCDASGGFLFGFGEGEYDLQHMYFTFPCSLKMLSLTGFCWDDVSAMSGSLPCLEVLKLTWVSGIEWKVDDDHFPSLKFLKIFHCMDLEHWTADGTPFPRLERLFLMCLENLDEIPSCFRDISTLGSITVNSCGESVVVSANRIKDEQEAFGNSDLHLVITQLSYENETKTEVGGSGTSTEDGNSPGECLLS